MGGGGGVKKAVICTSDFKMFRISFTWQFPVDYSAIGLYINILFVVNIISFTKLSTNIVDEFFSVFYFTFSFNVNVYTYHLSQNVTCIYLVYIYRSIICCFVPNAFCSYNSICYFCLQVTFIELYTCTGTSITSENGDKIEIIRLHCLFHLQSKK